MDLSSALPVSHMHFQGEVMEDQEQVYQIKKPQTALGESASKKTCHKEAPDTEFIYLLQ